jgi:hypothetical protein
MQKMELWLIFTAGLKLQSRLAYVWGTHMDQSMLQFFFRH